MALNRSAIIIKITVLCILAAAMNFFLSYIFMNLLRFPLFLDTVFTAAVTFSFGLIPGLSVAVFSWLIPCIYYNVFSLFVLCGITEVLLVSALKPGAPVISDFAPKDKLIAAYTGIAAKLFLLYLVCALSISVLGGVINYVSDLFLGKNLYYSPEDTFKLGLIMNNLPALAVDILARIPVNIVDRFIVIFGGYFISRGLVRLIRFT